MKYSLLLIYHKFNLPVDCIAMIYNIIINNSANIIINAWYKHIKYKMTLFKNIISLRCIHSINGHFTYYSPFNSFIAYNFYNASRVINKFDDIETWTQYFIRLNNYFKFVPIINWNDNNIQYSYNALINFKSRISNFD